MGDPPVLRRLTNRDRGFYPLMGPFLSRRGIVKELGGPIWDDDAKTWWVALYGRAVAGFAAARDDGHAKPVLFQSAYVLPERRRRGVYRMLFTARDAGYAGRLARAVCTDASLPLFLAHGFVVVRRRGSYTEVRRDA